VSRLTCSSSVLSAALPPPAAIAVTPLVLTRLLLLLLNPPCNLLVPNRFLCDPASLVATWLCVAAAHN
jgi:hypothetical protein